MVASLLCAPVLSSLLSALVAAICDVGLDCVDHCLDCEHHSRVCNVALERSQRGLGSTSRLGNAGGIWVRGVSWNIHDLAAHQPITQP